MYSEEGEMEESEEPTLRRHSYTLAQGDIHPRQQMLRLTNERFDCYLNAGINVLFSSTAFTTFISSLNYEHDILREMRNIATKPPNSLYNLKKLRAQVGVLVEIGKPFQDHTDIQHDAIEWIYALLDAIEKTLEPDKKEELKILFNIKKEYYYQCIGQCRRISYMREQEPERFLKLPIMDHTPITSLQEAIANYVSAESKELITKNCEYCTSKQVYKMSTIKGFPNVLCIQYLRFRANLTKIIHCIQGTLELRVSEWPVYQLAGAIIHHGMHFKSGHYYTITKCCLCHNWYKLDDEKKLQLINNKLNFHLDKAYMMVYVKEGTQFSNQPLKQNCNHEEQEPISAISAETTAFEEIEDHELPSPGYVPRTESSTDQGHDDVTTLGYVEQGARQKDQTSKTPVLNKEETEYMELIKAIYELSKIQARQRNSEQIKKLRNLKYKHNKIKHKFQYLETVKTPMTTAARKIKERSYQTEEEKEAARAADQRRKKRQRSHQTEEEIEAARAADQRSKAHQRSNQTEEEMEAERAAAQVYNP